jgi:hypothetical protein
MKQIIFKEWREEMKVALLGLAIFIYLLTMDFRRYASQLESLNAPVTPLMDGWLRAQVLFFCSILGIALGWLQIRAEKHRDLWAFLIHRPMTRTTILRGKIAAGLCLYALGAGLPLLGLIALAWTPGHVAAPFEWQMTLPLAALFLLGIVYYFAGMLTGLRQARWYGSRGFGLGLAFLAAITAGRSHEFWQAFLILAITGGILALAVWGSFQSGGYYRTQSMPGKLALTAACVAAALFVVQVAIGLFLVLAPDSRRSSYGDYLFTKDGAVYKVTHHDIEASEITDLMNGKPLLDDKTGRPMKLDDLQQHLAPSWEVSASFGTLDERRDRSYFDNYRFYGHWLTADKTVWYLRHDGRLAAYDMVSRRQTATLEDPANSIPALLAAGFIPSSGVYQYGVREPDQGRILVSAKTVYLVDLPRRALKPIWTVGNDDSIGGYASYLTTAAGQRVLVVTRKTIQSLDLNGQAEWSVPYQPSYPVYSRIGVLFLEPTNRFAVQFYPDSKADKKSGWTLPTRIEWLTAGEGISKSVDLPKLPRSGGPDSMIRWTSLLMPPSLSAAAALSDVFGEVFWRWNPWCLIPAGLCAIVGWWLGRRYSFPLKAQVGWTVFHLLFSLPGLLAFLSVQEWPARETCPRCEKLRVVDREQCPHCGADFAPPEKNGAEIFDPLAAN